MRTRLAEMLGNVWRATGIPAALASLERRMARAVRKRFGEAVVCPWCGEVRPDCDVCRK